MCYRLLDTPIPRRIIKDVIIYQFMEEEKHRTSGEIGKKGSLNGAETVPDELVEIDPADFIDPSGSVRPVV
jgi:hypothetical protein